jgi:hypothetical protein
MSTKGSVATRIPWPETIKKKACPKYPLRGGGDFDKGPEDEQEHQRASQGTSRRHGEGALLTSDRCLRAAGGRTRRPPAG